jgi:hypothetical protein
MADTKRSREPVWENLRSRPSWRLIEEVWRHPSFSYVTAAILFLLSLYFQWHLPPAIVAIILLSVAAAFTSLRGEMGGREKSFWFVVILLCALLAYRSDRNDGRKADDKLSEKFKTISTDAKNNLDALLTDSRQKFRTLLDNQNRQFQAMLDNQRIDFAQTVARLDKQERKQNEEFAALSSIKATQEDARLDAREITLELQAIRGEPFGQTSAPSLGKPQQNPIPAPEPQATKQLKIKALELARDIYDWIGLISNDAPKLSGPISQNAEEAKNLNAYRDRLKMEWQDKFFTRATNMVNELHIRGLLIACTPIAAGWSPTEILRFHTTCADHIRQAALELK